jgi:hypothetical protein
MKRETSIKKVQELISIEALIKMTHMRAQEDLNNYPLQLLNACFKQKDDKTQNWFTALAVLTIHRALYVVGLFQDARKAAGAKPLTTNQKTTLLNAIGQGAKLTKADAG